MIMQIIFTHNNGQDVANIPYELVNMKTKESCIHDLKLLFNGKYSFLPDGWKETAIAKMTTASNLHIPEELNEVHELVKISMLVVSNNTKMPKCPKWYNECNGKIFFEAQS